MNFNTGGAAHVQDGLERQKTRRTLFAPQDAPYDELNATKKLAETDERIRRLKKKLRKLEEDASSSRSNEEKIGKLKKKIYNLEEESAALLKDDVEVEYVPKLFSSRNLMKEKKGDLEETGKSFGEEKGPREHEDIKDVSDIPMRLRWYMDLILSRRKSGMWDKKLHYLGLLLKYGIYALYFAFVLASALVQVPGVTIPRSVEWLIFSCWALLIAVYSLSFVLLGGWFHFAWHGSSVIALHACELAIIVLFLVVTISQAPEDGANDGFRQGSEYLLLVVMGIYMFIREMIVFPIFSQLRLFFCGASSVESFLELIAEIEAGKDLSRDHNSDEEVIEIFELSRKVLGISEEVPIREALKGQHLRAQTKESHIGRSYDWAMTVRKLLSLVSLAPGYCRSKNKMSSGECRNLIRQVLVFDEMWRKTGKINADARERRSLPYSTSETMMAMLKLAFRVPWHFIHAAIPSVMVGFIMIYAGSILFANFARGSNTQNLCHCAGASPPEPPICEPEWVAVVSGFESPEQCREKSQKLAKTSFWALVISTSFVLPILYFWMSYSWSHFVAKLGDLCRRKMFAALVRGGTHYGEIHTDGKLTDAFSNQLTKLETFAFVGVCASIPAITALIASIITAIPIYPYASAIFISLIPVVLSFSFVDENQTKASTLMWVADTIFASRIFSIVECRPAIRTCDAGKWVETGSKDQLEQVRSSHQANYFMSGITTNLFAAMTSIFGLFILVPLGTSVLDGQIQFDAFLPIYSILMALQGTIQFVGSLLGQLGLYSSTLQIVDELMDNSDDEEKSITITNNKISSLSQEMAVNNVAFRYENMETNVLEKINLSFGKGMYVVLTGGSGSGKSTLLSLLMRFRKPNDGSIEWDGTNIFSASLESFREQVAVMFQKTMIYQATIRDNILFGMPERPGGVEEAAEMAEIAETILALPDGYDTVIGGDSAGGLSGGQMQRICLARALYRQPSVLLLDEATSALDAVTEDAIIETMVQLRDKSGITLVSVSHHPLTAVKANQIVVLDKGTIAEEGTFDELMAQENGIFRELVEISEKEKTE